MQGKVFLSFIVEKNGDLADIKVERKLGAGTDEEAVRIMKASPRWIPGIYNGKTVRVKYNIPINFSLTSDPPAGNKTGQIIGLSTAENGNKRLTLTGVATGKEPVIILDGKKFGSNLNEINPNNISSIEVLKDASATTLYGAAGANGVILITTKTALKTNKIESKKD
ncbi:Gram-negative bacterial tonB protein [compost metagenome]